MEYGYSILMGAFSAALLVYAGLMVLTKDYRILPLRARASVKPKDEKKYMTRLAGVIALVALSPALSALVGLWNLTAAFIVLLAAAILLIREMLEEKLFVRTGQGKNVRYRRA